MVFYVWESQFETYRDSSSFWLIPKKRILEVLSCQKFQCIELKTKTIIWGQEQFWVHVVVIKRGRPLLDCRIASTESPFFEMSENIFNSLAPDSKSNLQAPVAHGYFDKNTLSEILRIANIFPKIKWKQ